MQVLHRIIEKAWTEETTNKENPNIGQSDITALIIKALLGGRIVRLKTKDKDHYCNIINSTIVDYTNESFADYHLSATSIFEVEETELLENEELRQRYLTFLGNINHLTREELTVNLTEGSKAISLIDKKQGPYTSLDLNDYYDGGAYEMVGFTLGTINRTDYFEYIKDKEDGTVYTTSRTKKSIPKTPKLNPAVIEQVFSLARENKDTIETIKILEKKAELVSTN